METQDEREKGVCIVSFDGGGPGSISQLIIMNELLRAIEYDQDLEEGSLHPADYWDLMGGVGFGGLCALLLGRLRMSIEDAIEELAKIGTALFPHEADEITTPEANMTALREGIEDILRRYQHSVDTKLNDETLRDPRCKVVVFAAATSNRDYPHPFRSYRTRYPDRKCTFVEAACAILAIPQYFPPVPIFNRRIKQMFVGNPLGFNNPVRQVLEEALTIFGDEKQVSLTLSLGTGRPAVLSQPPNLDSSRNVLTLMVLDSERVSRELSSQLCRVKAYVRLNVDQGMENLTMTDWHEAELGSIMTHTDAYLNAPVIKSHITTSSKLLQERIGSISLGQLSQTNAGPEVTTRARQHSNHVVLSPTGVKQMGDIIRDVMHGITLVDAIGKRLQIPMEYCQTYSMLEDMVQFYFKHQKPPGAAFVKRGDYRLVHGGVGEIVEPARWTYDVKSGHTVEMSMIFRERNEYSVKCPRCWTLFNRPANNGWADCSFCSGRFQVETREAYENGLISPISMAGTTPAAAERGSRQNENERDGREQFRLISVINLLDPVDYPNQYRFRITSGASSPSMERPPSRSPNPNVRQQQQHATSNYTHSRTMSHSRHLSSSRPSTSATTSTSQSYHLSM